MTITLTREEAQQVLDVIERNTVGVPRREASDMLRDRLAQPEPEPVAWLHKQGNYTEPHFRQLDDDEIEKGWTEEPLYTAPPPCQTCVSLARAVMMNQCGRS